MTSLTLKFIVQLFVLILHIKKISLYEYDNSRFHCTNNKYIYQRWFCDNVNDCGDQSDESYGCDFDRCGRGNFTCENLQCKHISVRCDGKNDCTDGSDEKYCDHATNITECSLKKGMFLCKDLRRCVDVSNLCNGMSNCLDGSDENDLCYKSDEKCDQNCIHHCFRTPTGPKCFCYKGDTPQSNPLCKEVAECTGNPCQQRCVSFRTNEQCSCVEYYEIDSDSYSCRNNVSNSSVMVYATRDSVKVKYLTINKTITLSENLTNITAIAGGNGYVYWASFYSNSPKISRSTLIGDVQAPILTAGIKNVSDIDIDWITGNIYFTDNNLGYIGVCASNGRLCTKLQEKIDQPKALALAPKHGLLFFGTMGSNPFVAVANMSGGNFSMLDNDGVRSVWTISADEPSEEVYWLDYVRHIIVSIKFNGQHKKVILSDPRYLMVGVTVFENQVYWSAVGNSTIFASKYRTGYRNIKDRENKTAYNLYAFNPLIQKTEMKNPCPGSCGSGICLLTPGSTSVALTSTCKCSDPTYTIMSSDGTWCTEDRSLIKSTTTTTTTTTTTKRTQTTASASSSEKQTSKGNSGRMFIFIPLLLIVVGGVAYVIHKKYYVYYFGTSAHLL